MLHHHTSLVFFFFFVADGTKRRGDHPDHPASAQGVASIPSPTPEERGGVSAPRQGGVRHQVRHVGPAEADLPAHAEEGHTAYRRLRKQQEGLSCVCVCVFVCICVWEI